METASVLAHALLDGIVIAFLIFLMMVLIDYLNVASRGKLTLRMKGGKFRQYLTAALLGASPGCLGVFLTVTMYIHGLVGFGGMTAAALATAGDESFLMIALFPGRAALLFAVLIFLALVLGWAADLLVVRLHIKPCDTCMQQEVHDHPDCAPFDRSSFPHHLLHPSERRFGLLLSLSAGLALLVAQVVGPDGWNAWRIVFTSLTLAGMGIIATVPERYLDEHIWKHILAHHMPTITAWTVGALLLVGLVGHYWNIEAFVAHHAGWVLISALLVGLIPTSGPNFIFVTLFAGGTIPFSVLLANSIVQDGHGLLPLLGEDPKDFFLIKGYKAVLAGAIGAGLLALGW